MDGDRLVITVRPLVFSSNGSPQMYSLRFLATGRLVKSSRDAFLDAGSFDRRATLAGNLAVRLPSAASVTANPNWRREQQ